MLSVIFPEVFVAAKLFFNAYVVKSFANFCTVSESLAPMPETAAANSASVDVSVTSGIAGTDVFKLV